MTFCVTNTKIYITARYMLKKTWIMLIFKTFDITIIKWQQILSW